MSGKKKIKNSRRAYLVYHPSVDYTVILLLLGTRGILSLLLLSDITLHQPESRHLTGINWSRAQLLGKRVGSRPNRGVACKHSSILARILNAHKLYPPSYFTMAPSMI